MPRLTYHDSGHWSVSMGCTGWLVTVLVILGAFGWLIGAVARGR